MAEWKPKSRKVGLNPPFGYYPSPDDPNIMLPNESKLNALEHSFRMRAKFSTPIRDCCMWLQRNTGDRMSPAGYMYAYKNWIKKKRQAVGKKLGLYNRALKEAEEAEIDRLYGEFTVTLNDESIHALAEGQAETF